MQKRSFLKGLALAGLSAPFSSNAMDQWLALADKKTAGELVYTTTAELDVLVKALTEMG